MLGVVQLAYNNQETIFNKALSSLASDAALQNWSSKSLSTMHTVTIKFFQTQDQYILSDLARLRCPTLLVNCTQDIIYPRATAEELFDLLRQAKVDVELSTIEGAPHFGCATHIEETNSLLYAFVLGNTSAKDLAPAPARVKSPFLEELVAHGFYENDDSDTD
ncbi:hypothetical protein R3P38DRAFT_3190822 [Favolaschia claudopus]|uniref:Peptidase S33 tripeptidyl aminopeptidase-like C-terminal domain-containing protein n=1 Tax=Favolaschia claudopus TaxID=2862362 RepID=A0AAW0BP97_9AGAR